MDHQQLPDFGSQSAYKPAEARGGRGHWFWSVLLLVVIAAAAAGFYYFNGFGRASQDYRAVFLSNGQVYFGKLTRETSRYLYLDDVYYIQVQEQTQAPTTEGGQPTTVSVPTLLKRGSELHQPYGSLLLNRDQVVAIENVGADSQVLQQIKQLQGTSQ